MAFTSLSGPNQTNNLEGVEVRVSSVLTSSYVYTNWIDIRLFEAIDWVVYLTSQGIITRLDIVVQHSIKITPNETTDWTNLQAENINTSGIATLTDYSIQKTISDVITLGISSPARGRFMRLGIKVGVGSGINSLCSIDVLRRKPRTT